MVDRAMTELELVSFRPSSQGDNLGSKADTHHREIRFEELASSCDRLFAFSWIPGSIANHNPAGLELENIINRVIIGNPHNVHPTCQQVSQYSVFHPAVYKHDRSVRVVHIMYWLCWADILYKVVLVWIFQTLYLA